MAPAFRELRDKWASKWWTCLFLASVVFFVLLIVLASWAPHSQMSKLAWMPGWIAKLADREPNIRTAVPFMPLAGLLFMALSTIQIQRPLRITLTICGFILCVTEFGQAFLPQRTVDWKDLLWGTVGILLGTAGAKILIYWRKKYSAC
ncbi:VanZ family protein [Verrucomicrobiaceae bacterium 5K15]|uniref:VanZ family protein n=1 Tax=Oceaniferula flava TaxID=2800421 RepID=A0AAE2VDB1_9BACT|nr:VanZ family protein [Oceaniferula flavus]MBK1856545.1 VanZ family protein [Oceaniferula flavus]MBM1137852.1 VanZ family protein [Oceaniferula flavus]